MLFVLAFLPIAAGGSKLDLQHELELQLLGDDQPMVLSSLSATSAKSVSLAHTAAILASQPAPLRPLGEDAATPSAAPAKSAVPAALRAMSGPQRVAVCELDTEKCRAVAAAFVDDADGVCDFFQSAPQGTDRPLFCKGLSDALTGTTPAPPASPAVAPAAAPPAAPAASSAAIAREAAAVDAAPESSASGVRYLPASEVLSPVAPEAQVLRAAPVEPATQVTMATPAEEHTEPSSGIDVEVLCTSTLKSILPLAHSLADAQRLSGRIADSCLQTAKVQAGDDAVRRVCWELDGRVAMALEEGFEAKAEGRTDPYANERPSVFCARFAAGLRRAPSAPASALPNLDAKVAAAPAAAAPPAAQLAAQPAAQPVAAQPVAAQPVAAQPAAPAQLAPHLPATQLPAAQPAAAKLAAAKPALRGADLPMPATPSIADAAPADTSDASKITVSGLVALLRTISNQNALASHCDALISGLRSTSPTSAGLGEAPLEAALPFNSFDQRLLGTCAQSLQADGARILEQLANVGMASVSGRMSLLRVNAISAASLDAVLEAALDTPWAAEVCNDMASSYLRTDTAARATFCATYQGRYTSVEDDVSKLRRKPLKKDTVADAERESQSSGSTFLEDVLHSEPGKRAGNAAAVLWELAQPPVALQQAPRSLLETNSDGRGAAFWRRHA